MATTTRNVQPGLIVLGLALVAAGAVVLLLLGWQTATADSTIVGGAVPAQRASPDLPSRAWPILAGLLMACGAATASIGLNRWFGRPR